MDTPPPTQPNGTLILKIKITRTLMLDFFTGRRTLPGIPPDAELVSWWRYPVYTGEARLSEEYICLKVEHSSFPVPEPGTRYAELEPQVEIVPASKVAFKDKVPSTHTSRGRTIRGGGTTK